MKQQAKHHSNMAGSDQHIKADGQGDTRFVSCHLKLSPVADRQLIKIQQLLRNENIKLSKTAVINFLLENLKTDNFSGHLSEILGNKLQNKIAQVFLNSDMNDEDLKILNNMKNNNKPKV